MKLADAVAELSPLDDLGQAVLSVELSPFLLVRHFFRADIISLKAMASPVLRLRRSLVRLVRLVMICRLLQTITNFRAYLTFTRLDPSQWKAARTTNAIERLNKEFRRRIKTQTVLPCAETVPMLLWALLASGQTPKRKIDGWQTLDRPIEPMPLDRAA